MASKSVVGRTGGAVSLPPRVQELKEILRRAADLPDLGGSAGAIVADIQARILGAETLDDVFEIANRQTESVGDWVDKPIEITDFRVLASSAQYRSDEGLDAYLAIAFVNLATGEAKVLTAGGEILITMLWKFRELGALPIRCAFTTNVTANGYTVHKLRPLTDHERRSLQPVQF